ncbi:MAG: hypothetical protein ABL996_21670 [Micropepsaceae bacterium]
MFPEPNPENFSRTFTKFGFYRNGRSSPDALDLWFSVLGTLVIAAEQVTAPNSVEFITVSHLDALCLDESEWLREVPDAKRARGLMKGKFLLGLAGLYRTSLVNRWLDLLNPMFERGSLLMMESVGGVLIREVLAESAKTTNESKRGSELEGSTIWRRIGQSFWRAIGRRT